MGNAYKYRMPSGIPGDISRGAGQATVESIPGNSSLPFGSYGVFGKLSGGKFIPLAGGEIASAIYGMLVRPFPTQGANASDPLGTAVPAVGGIKDVLRRGYAFVMNNSGVPAQGNPVYVRVANASGGKPINGIEAANETTVASVAGSNTGNGSIGTMSATAAAKAGAYKVTATAATTFTVSDPDGIALKDGATGAAYTAGGLTFTNTAGGTPYVAGDSFTVTVSQNLIAVPGAIFNGPADASGNVEIAYNI